MTRHRSRFGTVAACIGFLVVLAVAGSALGWCDRARSQELPRSKPVPAPVQIVPGAFAHDRPTLCAGWDAMNTYAARVTPFPHASGIVMHKSVLVSTDKAGNFVILIVQPDGLSCILASGTGWTIIEKIFPPGRDS